MPGLTTQNREFSLEQKRFVWAKAQQVPGKDNHFKLDPCGALMEWGRYAVTVANGTGWEIDHLIPVSKGGTDALDNLQALQWEHNRAKGDGPNSGYCTKKWTGGR